MAQPLDEALLARKIGETRFVVVDLETTGGPDGATAILEIGAVRVEAGRLAGTFETLVDPGRPVHPFVTRLTGIDDSMVEGAPAIAEALPRFLAFAGDAAVLVAHNAPFDARHLDAVHERLFGRPLALPVLCTIRLTRRLLPEVRRRGLDYLAAHLGVAAFVRHRALADARITAEIFCILLERAGAAGVQTVGHLLALQWRGPDGHALVVHVPRERLHSVPQTAGVYHLLGADGRVLYVGKASRLQERVRSHFAASARARPRRGALVRQVHDVRTFETRSELAAALLEMRHIRIFRPPFNRAGRQLPRVPFIRLARRGAFPRLALTWRLGFDRAAYVGPFATRQAAERAQAVLARTFGLRTCAGTLTPSPDFLPCTLGRDGTCPAPCAARIASRGYHQRVDACLAFLEGRDATALDRLETREDRALLDGLRRGYRHLASITERQHFLVLVPTEDPGAAQLYIVLGGRLALDLRITAAADVIAAWRFVADRLVHGHEAPLARADVGPSTVLAAWLRDRANEGILLPFDSAEDLASRLDEVVVTLDDLRQRGPLPRIDGLT